MEFRYEELVENEKTIGQLLLQGLTAKTIADQTGMNRRVVNTHIRNMKVKLHAKDIYQLRQQLKQLPES